LKKAFNGFSGRVELKNSNPEGKEKSGIHKKACNGKGTKVGGGRSRLERAKKRESDKTWGLTGNGTIQTHSLSKRLMCRN